MERRLFIVRHGKSSWEHENLDDVDRPLAERGKRNAWEMAGRMLEDKMVPAPVKPCKQGTEYRIDHDEALGAGTRSFTDP